MTSQVSSQTSDERFFQRISDDLLDLKGDFVALVEDHTIYWQVQDLIKSNARLLVARSCFFDMMNDSFSYWAAIRVRRIVDSHRGTVSLLRLLRDIAAHANLFRGKTTEDDVRKDIRKLEDETSKIKEYVDQYVAHRDRHPTADVPLNRELSHAVEMLADMFHKYYAILRITDIDLQPSYLGDPLAIFDYAWRTKVPTTSML